MSDELPDDVESWPRDPYSLLGVDVDTDIREVKRRYLRLVRRFKPDQSPAAFQRIREAYERIQAQDERRSRFSSPRSDFDHATTDQAIDDHATTAPAPDDRPAPRPSIDERDRNSAWSNEERDETHDAERPQGPSPNRPARNESPPIIDPPARVVASAPVVPPAAPLEPVVADLADTDGHARPTPSPAAPSPPVPNPPVFLHSQERTPEQIWEMAVNGHGAEAYEQFKRSLLRPRGRKAETCLRLYWLLLADPRLDQSRSPYHWLLEALREPACDRRIVEIYRRELNVNASIVSDPLATDLPLCVPNLQHLPDVLAARWLAFYRQKQPHLIVRDLEVARSRFKFDAEEAWAKLLLLALGYLLFLDDSSIETHVLSHLREEFGNLEHVIRERHDLADRLDGLLIMQPGWKRLTCSTSVPPAWLRLATYGWFELHREARSELEPFLCEIVANPSDAFSPLDEMEEAGSYIVEQIAHLVRTYGVQRGRSWPKRDPTDLANSANLFRVHCGSSSPYVLVRLPLFFLCLSEAAMPEDFLDYFQDYEWVADFERDNVMRLLLRANSVLDG